MNEAFDVAVIGTGPAGVSAGFPLAERGLRTLMIDAGELLTPQLPDKDYLTARRTDSDQWQWMIGDDFFALRGSQKASPKFRVPALKNVFEGFAEENKINGVGFDVVGALSVGGLSNAWGCGVARLDDDELSDFPFRADSLTSSYESVARRIGISGRNKDDLSTLLGLDEWIQNPIELDKVHGAVFARYGVASAFLNARGFRMGRSRTAVISEDIGTRRGCDRLGTCLWGCERNALYSSRTDLVQLTRKPNVSLRANFVATHLRRHDQGWTVEGHDRLSRRPMQAKARTLFVAAGTLATTRLVLEALDLVEQPVRVLSNPTAGFLVWFPSFFGIGPERTFGLSQLSFMLEPSAKSTCAFGGLFSTFGLPVSEFVNYIPLAKRFGIDLLKYVLPSSLAGNVFLPGALSNHSASLNRRGELVVSGGFAEETATALIDVRKRLSQAFRKLGGVLPSRGFVAGAPGSDIHYAGGVPMRELPKRGEADPFGEVCGLPGLFVVDGAGLPTLSVKPHTLTVMANADRIGRMFASRAH